MTFDDTYRVGRCPNTRCAVRMGDDWIARVDRPAFAWKANTGLRIDDGMRCPNCGQYLNKTSREAHGLKEFTEDQLLKVFTQTRSELLARLQASQSRLAEVVASDMDDEFILDIYRDHVERDSKDYTRVDDGFQLWMRSGTER